MHNREITHIVKTDSLSKTPLVVKTHSVDISHHFRQFYFIIFIEYIQFLFVFHDSFVSMKRLICLSNIKKIFFIDIDIYLFVSF